MRSYRMLAMAAVLAVAGCASLGTSSPAEATTVAAAEQGYTTAAHLEVVWLNSGKATPAQAQVAKALREAVYADVVAGRTAVASNDSAAIAVALKLFNQALPAFTGYLAGKGGAS
jgi:membrane-bound lytic murein transglycosylase B